MSKISNKKLTFYVLSLIPAILTGPLAMDIYVPAVPQLPTLLHTDTNAVQWTLSIYLLSLAIGQIIFGPIADRFGRRFTLLSSMILYCVASFLCAASQTIEFLIVMRLIQAVGACGCGVATLAIIRDSLPVSQQPRAYSYLGGAIGIAPVLAPILGAYLLIWFGSWRSCFIALGVFSLISWVWFFSRLKETLAHEHRLRLDRAFWAKYWKILHSPTFCYHAWGAAAAMCGLFVFFSLSSILFINLLGATEKEFALYFGLNALTLTFANFLSPEIQHRLSHHAILWLGFLCMFGGGLAMLIGDSLYGLQMSTFLYPMLLASFGIGLIGGPVTAGALRDFPQLAGSASSLLGLIRFGVPACVGAWVINEHVTSGLPLAWTLIAVGGVSLIFAGWYGYYARKGLLQDAT